MDSYVTLGTYKVAECYHQFMNKEVLPLIGIDSTTFWDRLSQVLDEHLPANHELLEKRQILQAHIDDWHLKNPFPFNFPLYKKMLEDIGYLVPEGPDFTVSTTNVDPEISDIAGPQLVVPITNPRYALNAANAR